MSMRKFYSLVAMVQRDDIREQLFAWAAENIVEINIEHAEDRNCPSDYVQHNAERAMTSLVKSVVDNAYFVESIYWTRPNETKITRKTIRILKFKD